MQSRPIDFIIILLIDFTPFYTLYIHIYIFLKIYFFYITFFRILKWLISRWSFSIFFYQMAVFGASVICQEWHLLLLLIHCCGCFSIVENKSSLFFDNLLKKKNILVHFLAHFSKISCHVIIWYILIIFDDFNEILCIFYNFWYINKIKFYIFDIFCRHIWLINMLQFDDTV